MRAVQLNGYLASANSPDQRRNRTKLMVHSICYFEIPVNGDSDLALTRPPLFWLNARVLPVSFALLILERKDLP
jgi:hypothetical protein